MILPGRPGSPANRGSAGIRLSGHELPRSCVVSQIVYHRQLSGNSDSQPDPDDEAEQTRTSPNEHTRHRSPGGVHPHGNHRHHDRPPTSRLRDRRRHHGRVVRLLHLRVRRLGSCSRQLFFAPAGEEFAQLLAFLTVGISFLFRPLGAFLAGHFGDKYGRKRRADAHPDPDGCRHDARRPAAHLRGDRASPPAFC